MIKRILAIAVIFLGTTAAWCILGSTIFLRTESTTSSLSGRVASTWGDTQEQKQPDIHYFVEHTETVTSEEKGKKITRQDRIVTPQPVALDSSKIRADFHVDYRQKGLLWFSTYQVAFRESTLFTIQRRATNCLNFACCCRRKKRCMTGWRFIWTENNFP